MKNSSHLKIRALTEGALCVAAAQILGYIKLWALPSGGSVTLGMLPIFIYCTRWGTTPGLLASFVFGLLQLLLDGAYAWGWQSMIGDYLLAYSVLGIAGLFKKKKKGFYIGMAVGAAARFAVALVTGAVVWGEYMPDMFFGMKMSSPWFYSALYNGSYILFSLLLCIVAGALLMRSMKKYIYGEDLYATNNNSLQKR